jgi:hypothetical protein
LDALYTADDRREHFLGAIVTILQEMTPNGTSKVLLIDGQQRLTTLLILLAALRDMAKERGNELAIQIEKLYLFNEFETGLEFFRLLPSEGDQKVFFALMNGDLVNDNHQLSQAHEYFINRIQSKKDGKMYDLRRLRDIIISNLIVVSIVLEADENPYRIFESLNYKGEPLTQADLIRNYFFMRISLERHKTVYKEYWLPMQQRFAHSHRDLLGQFMWRYLLKDGTFVRRGDVYAEFKKRLDLVADDQLITALQELARFAEYHECLLDSAKEESKGLREGLGRLNRWDVTTSYPFLLNVYKDYREDRISAEEFCQIIDTIESFVIRRTFCRIPTNELNRLFISLYRQLDRNDLVSSLCKALRQRRWPTDKEFVRGWETFPIYMSGHEKARLVLETLEKAYKHKESIDTSKLQIEHVMPQMLTPEWRQTLGRNADKVHSTYLPQFRTKMIGFERQ